MARFCTNCGAQINAAAAFCGGCGARAGQPMPTAAPAVKSSSLLKIVLFVFAGLALCGMLMMGALFYAGMKVKDRVEQTAAEEGIRLGDFVAPPTSGKRYDACQLFPRDEAGSVLGVAIARISSSGTGQESSCDYYLDAASQQEQADALEKALANLQQNDRAGLAEVEKLAKAFAGSAGGADVPYFKLTVDSETARQRLQGHKLAVTMMGWKTPDAVKLLGDDAVSGPLGSTFAVRKGDVALEMDLRLVPGGEERGVEVARRVLARLP